VLRTADGFARFRIAAVRAKFPEYQRILDTSQALANTGGEALRAANLDHRYVKAAAECARWLGATAIQAFTGDGKSAAAILFPGADEAVMIIMPKHMDEAALTGNLTQRTAAIIGDGVKASVAALKAHLTRQNSLLNVAKTEQQREAIEARRESLQQRINALLGLTAAPALPAPSAQ